MVESNEAQGQPSDGEAGGKGHVCPWWIGWLLLSPLRRLFENPERLLGLHVRPGMTVLEPGCGMGFFSLPLARMVGPAGRVVCVDLQPRMIAGLRRRAEKAGLAGRIEVITGALDEGALEARRGAVDLAVAIHMVHEVRDGAAFLRRLFELLRPGGRLLIVEPKGHVLAAAFERTVQSATAVGFVECGRPLGAGGRGVLLERPANGAA